MHAVKCTTMCAHGVGIPMESTTSASIVCIADGRNVMNIRKKSSRSRSMIFWLRITLGAIFKKTVKRCFGVNDVALLRHPTSVQTLAQKHAYTHIYAYVYIPHMHTHTFSNRYTQTHTHKHTQADIHENTRVNTLSASHLNTPHTLLHAHRFWQLVFE